MGDSGETGGRSSKKAEITCFSLSRAVDCTNEKGDQGSTEWEAKEEEVVPKVLVLIGRRSKHRMEGGKSESSACFGAPGL